MNRNVRSLLEMRLNSELSGFFFFSWAISIVYYSHMGYAVVQLVEALRYKPEGRGFDSQWCLWNFSFTQSFQPHYGPGVDSASNKNEYQEYFLGVKRTAALG